MTTRCPFSDPQDRVSRVSNIRDHGPSVTYRSPICIRRKPGSSSGPWPCASASSRRHGGVRARRWPGSVCLPCRFSRTGTGPRGGPRGCWAVSRTVPLSGRGRRPGRRFAAPGHRCRTRCPAPARSAGTHHVRLRAVPRTASDRPASAGAVGPGAVQQAVYEAVVRTPVTVWTSWTPNSTSTRTAPSSPHGCAFQRPPSGGRLAGGQRLAGHRHRRVRGRAVDRSVREAPFNRRASSRVTPRRT
ncbi:hypothetical protein C3K23_29975 [Streptomyces sp. 604F]|nr:hypothetical protein C3K23_29975 [Streptomyces sp. 604F]